MKNGFSSWMIAAALALGAPPAAGAGPAAAGPAAASELAQQAAQYAAQKPKSVIELLQFRRTATGAVKTQSGQTGRAALINLNPEINAWFLLKLDWSGGLKGGAYHLENARPGGQRVTLDPAYPLGVVLTDERGETSCDLWSAGAAGEIARAGASGETFAPLCGGRLYLRNPVRGHVTNQEWVTDMLREHCWQGEEMVSFVKSNFFQDAFRSTSIVEAAEASERLPAPEPPGAPAEALIEAAYRGRFIAAYALGIDTDNPDAPKYAIGRWYAVKDLPGAYVSTLEPEMVSSDLRQSLKGQIQPLSGVEAGALAYLTAFSLDRFDVGFALGTEHPGVAWSDRARPEVRDRSLPGPDGIGQAAPLVRTGLLSPAALPLVRAAFAGGYKRHHSAFKYGRLAMRNGGSHYGFIENGAVLSKLQPGLATLAVYADGAVEMKTWSEEDNRGLAHIRYARQNGVPIIEYDAAGGLSQPGPYVRAVGLGNWSGAEDASLRTLRAGICLQEADGHRHLIYGYFSSATPSAMAQVFQAYGCRYAMHLDMNALEHTYLAVYPGRAGGRFKVGHLMKGMAAIDKKEGGGVVPRFAGYADNRDFFYLTEKVPAAPAVQIQAEAGSVR